MASNSEGHNKSADEARGSKRDRTRLKRSAIKAAIENILSREQKIKTQIELRSELKKANHRLSAASLSRIAKAMGLQKDRDGFLTLDPARQKAAKVEELSAMLERHATTTFVPAGLVAVQTTPGFAGAVGALARQAYPEEVIGIIVGGDTVLLMLSHQGLGGEIQQLLSDIGRGGTKPTENGL